MRSHPYEDSYQFNAEFVYILMIIMHIFGFSIFVITYCVDSFQFLSEDILESRNMNEVFLKSSVLCALVVGHAVGSAPSRWNCCYDRGYDTGLF